MAVGEKRGRYAAESAQPEALLAEFRATLTSHESEFMSRQLLAESCDDQQGRQIVSRAAHWQATHRLYQKLLAFLGS